MPRVQPRGPEATEAARFLPAMADRRPTAHPRPRISVRASRPGGWAFSYERLLMSEASPVSDGREEAHRAPPPQNLRPRACG